MKYLYHTLWACGVLLFLTMVNQAKVSADTITVVSERPASINDSKSVEVNVPCASAGTTYIRVTIPAGQWTNFARLYHNGTEIAYIQGDPRFGCSDTNGCDTSSRNACNSNPLSCLSSSSRGNNVVIENWRSVDAVDIRIDNPPVGINTLKLTSGNQAWSSARPVGPFTAEVECGCIPCNCSGVADAGNNIFTASEYAYALENAHNPNFVDQGLALCAVPPPSVEQNEPEVQAAGVFSATSTEKPNSFGEQAFLITMSTSMAAVLFAGWYLFQFGLRKEKVVQSENTKTVNDEHCTL